MFVSWANGYDAEWVQCSSALLIQTHTHKHAQIYTQNYNKTGCKWASKNTHVCIWTQALAHTQIHTQTHTHLNKKEDLHTLSSTHAHTHTHCWWVKCQVKQNEWTRSENTNCKVNRLEWKQTPPPLLSRPLHLSIIHPCRLHLTLLPPPLLHRPLSLFLPDSTVIAAAAVSLISLSRWLKSCRLLVSNSTLTGECCYCCQWCQGRGRHYSCLLLYETGISFEAETEED